MKRNKKQKIWSTFFNESTNGVSSTFIYEATGAIIRIDLADSLC